MTSFTFYCTYMQLKTEQSMYSTDSSTYWLRVCFFFYWCAVFVTQQTTSGDDLIRIRIVGPSNFKQIERAGVWPESPGNFRCECGISHSVKDCRRIAIEFFSGSI